MFLTDPCDLLSKISIPEDVVKVTRAPRGTWTERLTRLYVHGENSCNGD